MLLAAPTGSLSQEGVPEVPEGGGETGDFGTVRSEVSPISFYSSE